MGGKSRKSGGISRALISRIKGGSCGGNKPKTQSPGLLDSLEGQSSSSQQLDDEGIRESGGDSLVG